MTELNKVYSHAIANITLSGDAVELYERWKAGAVTDEEVQAQFIEHLRESDSPVNEPG